MSGAKVAIIFGFPGVLVPCGHCFLSIFFPFGFRGRRFSVFPVPFGAVFSGSQAQRERRGVTYSVYFVLRTCFALHTVYILCCRCVCVTYSVYFMLRMCLALHTVYILYCRCVWRYIQCIFYVADVFSVTYSVYFVSSVGLKEKTDVSVRRTRWEEASNAV